MDVLVERFVKSRFVRLDFVETRPQRNRAGTLSFLKWLGSAFMIPMD